MATDIQKNCKVTTLHIPFKAIILTKVNFKGKKSNQPWGKYARESEEYASQLLRTIAHRQTHMP